MRNQILFGKRVRAIRKSANLSRDSLAERAGITGSYLGEIERGEKWPSPDILSALAKALDVSPARFFEFDSSPTDPQVLRKQIDQLLAKRDVKQLQQIERVLRALFDS